ncbi:hypothetical protein A8B74_15485 [Sulfitobacter geojensis]|uniref:DUF4214 domain-containing protein n=1 Tax=Sulfitobacter geojensis TaxID=1342299 RepID=UPI0007D8E69C|nr:DUF4214 domain-containing protein [Sulfitobacter geojensis]OAN95425.1 hypothetical protein A8B74_15485 [Sulfitobacter geojensis]
MHPFFADPATSTPSTFITSLYQNLFNRDPDAAGLEFWSEQLQNAIDGVEGSFSVGEIIVKIIEGAVDVEGGTQDRTTILNKIEVAQDWTDAAVADGGEFDADAMASAKAIIADVTSDAATVTAAKATTDAFFAPAPVPGDTLSLTSDTDVMTGTENDDQFNAYIQQNPFAGGVSNSLSSADRLDGGAGNDRLYAEVTGEFVGVVGNVSNIDIQPRLSGIEEIDIEARESTFLTTEFLTGGPVVVDAKNITDHVEIGSYFSDGDLKIENLTTLTAAGTARNTSEITVTMDHTDNFNSDEDASDLEVLFDNDYLLSGQTSVGTADFFLLDQDAELRILTGNAAEGRLDEIDKNGIRFSINGTEVAVTFDAALLDEAAAGEVNSHDAFIAALQADLQAKIADGSLPAGTQIVRFDYPAVIFDDDGLALNRAGLQDGSFSDLIPSIQVVSGDGSPVTPLGFTAPPEITGEFNIFGRFDDFADTTPEPVSIDIDLHKVGRGGDGGNLVIGGKQVFEEVQPGIEAGIEVFNIDVLGAGADDADGAANKPSSLGTVTSTQGALKVVNIETAAEFLGGNTFASLEIRDGFNAIGANSESGDLQRVNANGLLGDLYLGTDQHIINADAVTALGGGDVTFKGAYTGTEDGQEYTVVTGSGDDSFDIRIDGDAVDAVDEGFSLDMGNGDNAATVQVVTALNAGGAVGASSSNNFDDDGVSQETTQNLMNLDLTGGSGVDTVEVQGMGAWNIDVNAGSDMVYINSGGDVAEGNLWNTTGLAAFGPVVVYKAELAVSVAGFESVVSLDTGSDFILTQSELNAAVIRAIEQNPEISRLLTATLGTADQDLIIQSLIDGVNEVGFQIRQPELVAVGTPLVPGSAQVTLAASDVAGMVRDLVAVGSPFAGAPAITNSTGLDASTIAGYYGDTGAGMFGNTTTADGYTGQIFTQTASASGDGGTAGDIENHSVINMGTGANDLVVLSANHEAQASTTAPVAGQSQNTLVFDDLNAGKVSVVNWFIEDDTSSLITDSLAGTPATNGNHLLDFTAFLTNRSTDSGSSASAGAEAIIAIDSTGAGAAATTLEANSLNFLTVDDLELISGAPATGYNFDTLTSAQVKALIESGTGGTGIDYVAQNVSDGTTQGLVEGTTTRTSIIAIENVDVEIPGDVPADTLQIDNTNYGEYKFFQVIYGVDGEGDDSTVTVNEITVADFGASLDLTTLEVNLVGTDDYGVSDFV